MSRCVAWTPSPSGTCPQCGGDSPRSGGPDDDPEYTCGACGWLWGVTDRWWPQPVSMWYAKTNGMVTDDDIAAGRYVVYGRA